MRLLSVLWIQALSNPFLTGVFAHRDRHSYGCSEIKVRKIILLAQRPVPTTIATTAKIATTTMTATTATTTTIAASSTKTIAATPSEVPPAASGTSTPSDSVKNFQVPLLRTTNLYRYEHNAPFVKWNDSLASFALQWAQRCVFEHSSNRQSGENLYQGPNDPAAAVRAWGDERSLYQFTGLVTGFSEGTGHFTQLVWKETTDIGCGSATCPKGTYVVCEYYPAGNVAWANEEGNDGKRLYIKNVEAQVNNGEGFDETKAIQGTSGMARRSVGSPVPSIATRSPERNGAKPVSSRITINGADGNEDVFVNRHKGQLGMVLFLTFACAFM